MRYHAAAHGLPSVALRIGWLIPEDDPTAVGLSERPFMRGLYLSHRDAGHIFAAALRAPLPAAGVAPPFAIAYATSANGRSFLDTESSVAWLGYRSVDDAEVAFKAKGL
jgi:hypothetical protein